MDAEAIRASFKPEVVQRLAGDAIASRDYELFCKESLMVKEESGRLVPMELFPAQKKLNDLIERIRRQRRPVRIVVVKARRAMISTAIAAKFFQEVPQREGQQCAVLAHEGEATDNLFAMYQCFQEHYRPFRGVIGLPPLKKDTADRLAWTNRSFVTCHTAGSRQYGRSFSFRYVHFSEFAFYADQKSIFTSVMQCVPSGDPDTVVIVESTANGIGDEYYNLYKRAVSGTSEWELFFFAWHEHPLYVKQLAVSRDEFAVSLSRTEHALMRQYDLSMEQINWRRYTIEEKCLGSAELFKQEYPSSAEEAFLASGRPRFNHDDLERMQIIRDPLRGSLELKEMQGRKKLTLLPHQHGELAIFRQPEPHREYLIGADVCMGIDVNDGKGEADPDYSVIQVGDRDTGEVVARWRARREPGEFGFQLFVTAIYYNWAQIVPERNGPGLAALNELVSLGYPLDLIYHKDMRLGANSQRKTEELGFETTVLTRPLLIDNLDQYFRKGALLVHDGVTMDECRTFVIKPNGKAEHRDGCHDDTVIALALMAWGFVWMPRKTRVVGQTDGVTQRPEISNYRRNDSRNEERRGELRRILN